MVPFLERVEHGSGALVLRSEAGIGKTVSRSWGRGRADALRSGAASR
jgi:hypothetical protein